MQSNLHRDEILGNQPFPRVSILSEFSLSPLFPFYFQRKKQLDSIFKIEMPKIKVCKRLVLFLYFFFILVLFSPRPPPTLFLDFVSPWIVFLRGRWIFSSQRRIIRLATKPVESSKLNRNWIGPLHSLAGSSNVDRKSESV